MAEEPNRVAQRLRWWKESDTGTQLTGNMSIPHSVSAELEPLRPDIGEQLEEEALRRIAAQSRGERVEILAKPLPSNTNLLAQMLVLTAVVLAILAVPALLLHRLWLFAFILPLAAYFGTGWGSLLRFNSRPYRPAMTLTIEGIELCAFPHDIGLIRWGEIREIRAHTCINRYLGIVPVDTRSLWRRLPAEHSWLIRANSILERYVYRPFHRFMAPINLAQVTFPISVDVIVTKIEMFRRENSI